MRRRTDQLLLYRVTGLVLSLAIHALIIFAPFGMRATPQPFVVSLNIDKLRETDMLSSNAPGETQHPARKEPAFKQSEAPETIEQPLKEKAVVPQSRPSEAIEQSFGKEAVLPQTEAPEMHIPADMPAATDALAAKEALQQPPSAQEKIARESIGPLAPEEAPSRVMSEMPIEAPAVMPAAQAFAQEAPQAAPSIGLAIEPVQEPEPSSVPTNALQPLPDQAKSLSRAENPLPEKPKQVLPRGDLASSLIALSQSILENAPVSGRKQAKVATSGHATPAVRPSVASSAVIATQENVLHDDTTEIRAEHANDFLAKRRSASLSAFQSGQKLASASVPAILHESQLQPIAPVSTETSLAAGSQNARAAESVSLTNQPASHEDFGPANAVVDAGGLPKENGTPAMSDVSEFSGIDAPEPSRSTVSPSISDIASPPLLPAEALKKAQPEPIQYDTIESLASKIAQEMAARKQYPASALKRKSEGTVRIALQIAPDGTLASSAIQSRSGSAVLDEAALQLVRSIFPMHIRLEAAVSLLIPVEYRIPR